MPCLLLLEHSKVRQVFSAICWHCPSCAQEREELATLERLSSHYRVLQLSSYQLNNEIKRWHVTQHLILKKDVISKFIPPDTSSFMNTKIMDTPYPPKFTNLSVCLTAWMGFIYPILFYLFCFHKHLHDYTTQLSLLGLLAKIEV